MIYYIKYKYPDPKIKVTPLHINTIFTSTRVACSLTTDIYGYLSSFTHTLNRFEKLNANVILTKLCNFNSFMTYKLQIHYMNLITLQFTIF